MLLYFVKLFILLPLVGGMAYGALWLWRKYQPGLIGAQSDRAIRILEMLPLGTFGKLAVVEFDGKRLLVSITRGRIEKLAEGHDAQSQQGQFQADPAQQPGRDPAQTALQGRLSQLDQRREQDRAPRL